MPIKTVSNQNQTITNSTFSLSKSWKNFKVVTQPYWYPKEKGERSFAEVIQSWGMFCILILLIVGSVLVSGLGSFWNRYILDIIIEDRDLSKYLNTIWLSCLLIAIITILAGFSEFVRKKLALDWYKYSNNYILKQYLGNRVYYQLDFTSDFDNTFQFLTKEIELITSDGLRFVVTLLEKALEMTTFIIILWTISQKIALYLVIYTIISNLIGIYLNRKLNNIKQEELELKANYNNCLTHVSEHSESIAFFQGEVQEFKIIERKFNNVLENAESKVNWERVQNIFNRSYQSAVNIFSLFIITPLFIQDKINYGEIVQASFACFIFSNAVKIFIDEWGILEKLLNYSEGLDKFLNRLKAIVKPLENLNTITTIEDNYLAFENVTLQTPNYEKIIIENLSLSLPLGEGLLIVGPSGCGKSSLLLAITGLWNAGTGRLVRPCLEEMLFLTQRPYFILGTLREELLYPQINRQISDQELYKILQQVNLQYLLKRIDNFDVELPWEKVLSLGEKQRLAIARILVNRPRFAILDEATSALDLKNEENLYQQLQDINTTIISVSHRESLFKYHQWVLEILEDSSWQLISMQEYKEQKNN